MFGVEAETVRTSWARNGMPKPDKRGADYDLVAVGEWLRGRDAHKESTAELRHKKLEAEARHKAAQAARVERDNSVRTGELIPSDEAQRQQRELVLRVKDRINRIPGEIGRYIPKAKRRDVEKSVRGYTNGVLTEMSEWRFDGTDVDVDDDDTA